MEALGLCIQVRSNVPPYTPYMVAACLYTATSSQANDTYATLARQHLRSALHQGSNYGACNRCQAKLTIPSLGLQRNQNFKAV